MQSEIIHTIAGYSASPSEDWLTGVEASTVLTQIFMRVIPQGRIEMLSKITKTVGGKFQINKTGSIVESGMRVAAGCGEDYDNGRIDSIDGDTAIVCWDSLVVTPLVLTQDDVRILD